MTYSADITGFRRTPLGATYYRIKVSDSNGPGREWTVERRFRDFSALRSVLKVHHHDLQVPYLPSKSIIAYFATDSFLEDRARALSRFLTTVLTSIEPDPQSVQLRSFLNIIRPHSGHRRLDTDEDEDMQLPHDAIVGILSYLKPKEQLRVGLTNRGFHRASCSPVLWHSIMVASDKFESIQKGFMSFMGRAGIAEHVQSLVARVQFSNELSYNLSLSLPGDVYFIHLARFEFSSLNPLPHNAQSSTRNLCQELLEAIFAHSAPLVDLRVESEVSTDMLRTILGITNQCKLRTLRLAFIGSPVDISETDFGLLSGIIKAVKPVIESLKIKVKYPENWSSAQLGPDSYFGERIGHYKTQQELTRSLLGSPGAFPELKVLEFPFLAYSELLNIESPKFPSSLEEIKVRVIVDGIGNRAEIDRSNRTIIGDMFMAVTSRCRILKISTVGGDEQDMHQTYLMPYIIPSQAINFEQLSSVWLGDWRERMVNLESLVIAGPCTGFSKLVGHIIKANLFETFLANVPKMKELQLINNISTFDDNAVLSIVRHLPLLNKLVICGNNELLTDRLLVSLPTEVINRRNLQILRLPLTRYMSYIGLEAVQRLCVANPALKIDVSHEMVETGRRVSQ